MTKQTILLIALTLSMLAPQIVLAATGGTALPWETPLVTLQASLTGPVALAIGVIAIAIAGAMLIFGGEINNFARMSIYIILVLGLLLTANNLLSTLYTGGAVIPQNMIDMTQSTLMGTTS